MSAPNYKMHRIPEDQSMPCLCPCDNIYTGCVDMFVSGYMGLLKHNISQ
jgi:hypothetical protein